jgi:hypothetical protein
MDYRREVIPATVPSETADHPRMYILSITTANVKSGESKHAAEVLIASSVEEAKQKGFEQARMSWPIDDGWMEHNVEAKEAGPEIVSQAASLIR